MNLGLMLTIILIAVQHGAYVQNKKTWRHVFYLVRKVLKRLI